VSDTPECSECNRPYQIRPDSELTDYCDECAQLIVSKLETALADANEELESSRTKLANLHVDADGLKAEIERMRGEIEKAWEEGFKSGPDFWKANARWHGSRAKRVMEGKE